MKEDTTEQDHDLHLGTVEEKVYNRYVGKHIQRQGHLEEFRVCVSRLSCGMWGEEKGGDRGKGASRRETQVGVAGQSPEMPVTDVGKMLSKKNVYPGHPKWNGTPVRDKNALSHRGKVSLFPVIGAQWT